MGASFRVASVHSTSNSVRDRARSPAASLGLDPSEEFSRIKPLTLFLRFLPDLLSVQNATNHCRKVGFTGLVGVRGEPMLGTGLGYVLRHPLRAARSVLTDPV